MSDTTTITPEERARLRSAASTAELCCLSSIPTLPPYDAKRLLDALEAAEARADEYKGFIAALVAGLRQRWPQATVAMTCEAYTAGDVFSVVLDPVVTALNERAEKAEADNARLTKMVDWLASWGDAHPCLLDMSCPFGTTYEECECAMDSAECWKEAARRAVAAQSTTEAVSTPCPICGAHGHIGDCEGD